MNQSSEPTSEELWERVLMWVKTSIGRGRTQTAMQALIDFYLAQQRVRYEARLKRIATIIERVDERCMAVDGPVTPTLEEMTQREISEIYSLAALREERPV